MTDLTPDEETRVRTALRFLAKRTRGWKPLAKVLGFSIYTVRHVNKGEKGVSASMALRVARLASAAVDDLLAGEFSAARDVSSLRVKNLVAEAARLAKPSAANGRSQFVTHRWETGMSTRQRPSWA